jgi:hypothetical protein
VPMVLAHGSQGEWVRRARVGAHKTPISYANMLSKCIKQSFIHLVY